MKSTCSNRFLSTVCQFLAGQAIILGSFGTANAATYYWDTDSTTAGFGTAGDTWGISPDWSTSPAGTDTPTAAITTTADLINFGNGATGLAAGTIAVNSVSSGDITFASGSGAIVLSGGTITLGDAAIINLSNATDTISSVIAGAATSLAKTGAGTLILSGANTYTGATTVAGKLNLQNNTALGGSATGTTVASGSELQLQNDITVTGETLGIAGHSSAFALRNISGNNTWAGTINVNTSTLLARIASDTGTLTLSDSVVVSGTIANGLVLQGAGSGWVSGIISGTGNLTRSSVGTGTWTLSGPNTYSGLTTVSNILNVRNNSALGSTIAGTTVSAGGSLQLQGGVTIAGEALTLTAVVGSNALPNGLVNVSGNNEWAGTLAGNLTSGNNIRLSSAADTLTVSGNVAITSAAAGNSLVLTGAGNGVVSGAISVGATSSTSLIKSGTGTWVSTGAHIYEGATQIQAGALSVATLNSVTGGSASSNLGAPKTAAAGTITLALVGATLTPGKLIYTGSGETTDRIISLTGYTAGGIIQADNASGLLKFTSAMTAPGIALQDNRKSLTLAGSGTAEFAGAIVNTTLGGAGQLATSVIKAGAGTWTLSGANTYSGDTIVNGGVLAIKGSSLEDTNKLVIEGGKVEASGTEIVGSLYFGGVQQLDGTWGSNASDAAHKDDTRFSGTGMVRVTTGPLVGFGSWVTGFDLAVADQDPASDPDADGLNNLLEYTLGGNPGLTDAASIVPTGSKDGLGNYTFTFQRSDLSETDSTQFVEYGNDLTVWGSYPIGASPGTAPVVIQEDLPSSTIDTVTVSIPTLGATKFFARLKVGK
jgi:autotransporter-associated beta strand protein